jgi:hypothetical protein
MDKKRRKELLQECAERQQPVGVFAVHNTASGEVWVGHSRNLDVQKNGLWVRLAGGMSPNADVQASWKEHGEAAFSYEILEHMEPDRLRRNRLRRSAEGVNPALSRKAEARPQALVVST